MTVYFTSDQHHWHDNERGGIIAYESRPFVNLMSQEVVIRTRHNDVVGPDDTVYFLGDFCFSSRFEDNWSLLSKLNGRKILIRGNHDHMTTKKYKEAGFDEVYTTFCFGEYLLVHNPADNYFNCLCLCGHVHSRYKTKDRNINVGVDVRNFTPISEDQVREIAQSEGLIRV